MTKRYGTACHLCAEAVDHVRTPVAVAMIARVKVCAKHLRLLEQIATDSGVSLDRTSDVALTQAVA